MVTYIMETDEDDDWSHGCATIIRVNEDGSRTEVGWIGSEPEDNTYYRAYSWILPELNEAYRQGIEAGKALVDPVECCCSEAWPCSCIRND